MFGIEGKVALITGAIGGIGRGYVRALLKQNAKGVALIDIDEKGGEEFQKELVKEYGPNKTIFTKVDVTDSKQLEDAFQKAVDHFKQLDIVINNAGIIDEINVERCIKVNVIATLIGTNLAFDKYLPKYKSGTEGVVVNTASIAGFLYDEWWPTYVASKHALVALGRTFGSKNHYERDNIKIITICPGHTDTQINPRLPDHLSKIAPTFDNSAGQSVTLLGDTLINVLQNGDTGSVWVVNRGKEAMKVDFEYIQNYLTERYPLNHV